MEITYVFHRLRPCEQVDRGRRDGKRWILRGFCAAASCCGRRRNRNRIRNRKCGRGTSLLSYRQKNPSPPWIDGCENVAVASEERRNEGTSHRERETEREKASFTQASLFIFRGLLRPSLKFGMLVGIE